ncbi:hypothetical protein [Aliiglaciecola sp. NS0011-25]|uniref:hypothetical protein n=1 Tax=Aliiglaciecola sp. NS0011-25 TaxID=3127654 RepID=UPI00310939E5
MKTEYYLESSYSISNKSTKITIEKSKYERLKECKVILSEAFALEEKYELLISNYNELETQLLKNSLSFMLDRTDDIYHDGFEERLMFNRWIVNLLSSAKMIFDQVNTHVRKCLPYENGEVLKERVNSLYSREYDKHFEYRFMCALRNFVQHCGLAVHVVKRNRSWTEQDSTDRMKNSVIILTKKANLSGEKRFKRDIYHEMPSEMNLIYSTRVFLESISKVHIEIRKLIETSVLLARTEIEETLSEYSKAIGRNVTTVEACSCEFSNHEEVAERVQIFLEWDDIRVKLTKRNKGLINLHKRFVTNLMNPK